jgi:hypothetical protein
MAREASWAKGQKGHGTVENSTGLLDCNTIIYKKRESKQQRGPSTIYKNFQQPKKISETSV